MAIFRQFILIFMEINPLLSPALPHSCYPNCGINLNNEIVLIRPVKYGEPLTLDYATLYVGLGPEMDCHCGFNGCRGKILGFNFLPVIFQEYYLKKNAVCREVRNCLHLSEAPSSCVG